MKWLEIKTNPPERNRQSCLVCDKKFPNDESISAIYALDRKEFFNVFNNVCLSVKDITHWMPMPNYKDFKPK